MTLTVITDTTRENSPSCPSHEEAGFMLAMMAVLILVIVALLSTFAFVANRDGRFKGHYATGERVANLVTYAHLFSQTHYFENIAPAAMEGTELFPLIELADGGSFPVVSGISYEIDVRGWGESPINTTGVVTENRAVSAYVHIKLRPTIGLIVHPSDRTAFLAGASKRGMSRAGIVGMNIPAGDECDGDPNVVVRWGPEASACLSETHIAQIGFTDIEEGDIIVPAWETALAVASRDAMYRFKQPERPDLNTMRVPLNLGGNPIEDAKRIVTRTITVEDDTHIASSGRLIVRNGGTTNITGAATVSGHPLNVLDRNAPPAGPATDVMNVSGSVQFNSNVNVAKAINTSSIPLVVNVANPFLTDAISPPSGSDLTINPMTGSSVVPMVAVQNVMQDPSTLTLSGAGKTLTVAGTLRAGNGTLANNTRLINAPGKQMNIYTGHFQTNVNAANPVGMTLTVLPILNPFTVGAVEQIGTGATKYLRIPELHVFDCIGTACPDYVTTTPGGGL